MELIVDHYQWPVGQGCFASCDLSIGGTGSLNYIYDCGARSRENVEIAVREYAAEHPACEALFISHLDADHVSGLDQLLESVDVRSVYLPYLNWGQIALSIAHEGEAGHLNANFVQAMVNPGAWFGARGVERVVFVGGGEDFADTREGPPSVGDPDRDGRAALALKAQAAPSQLGEAKQDGAELLYLQHGVGLRVTGAGAALNWLLLPYVPRVESPEAQKSFEIEFSKVVCDFLNLPADTPIASNQVMEVLATKNGRKLLRQPYDNVYPKGGGDNHNRISMSLYSGPFEKLDDHLYETVSGLNRHKSADHFWVAWWVDSAGWMGTGDAKLSVSKVRSEWVVFYQEYLDYIGSILLPHHGSRRNFDRSLLDHVPAKVWIAAADEVTRGYGHPHASVRAAIGAKGRHLVHVTSDFSTVYRQRTTI